MKVEKCASGRTFSLSMTALAGFQVLYSAKVAHTNTSFVSNQAAYGGAVSETTSTISGDGRYLEGNAVSASGGAVYLDRSKNATIHNAVFRNNSARDGGAATQACGTEGHLKSATFWKTGRSSAVGICGQSRSPTIRVGDTQRASSIC